jgi:histidine triad (HIT) family protein
MESIFSKIISGQIPAHKVAETENFLAFLDIHPLQQGHVLVIPKVAIDYIFDIDDSLYTSLMLFAKTVAKGIKIAIPCTKVGVAVIGLEVPHAHIHLIPIQHVADINFSKPKLNPTETELSHTAFLIQQAINTLL